MSNNEIEVTIKDIPEVAKQLEKLQQENKQLKEELESKKKMYWQNLAAMRGLILTELEEDLKEHIEELQDLYDKEYFSGIVDEDRHILTFIQCLKEKYYG